MSDRLLLEYTIHLLKGIIDWETDEVDSDSDSFRIPIEHNDKLEDIVEQCLLCHRTVFIGQGMCIIMRISAERPDLSGRKDLRPPVSDKLLEYERNGAIKNFWSFQLFRENDDRNAWLVSPE